jgi:DNA-binding transcriptional ArsR family regulator
MAKSIIECVSPCDPAELSRILRALANPTRMRMINLMLNREVTSQQFARVLACGPSVMYNHLTCLRDSKLLAARRRGRTTYYTVRKGLSSTESLLLRLVVESLKAHSGLLHSDIDLLNLVSKYDSGRRTHGRNFRRPTAQDPVPIIPGDGPVLDGVVVDGRSGFRQSAQGRA